jgi:hypothetical protein
VTSLLYRLHLPTSFSALRLARLLINRYPTTFPQVRVMLPEATSSAQPLPTYILRAPPFLPATRYTRSILHPISLHLYTLEH